MPRVLLLPRLLSKAVTSMSEGTSRRHSGLLLLVLGLQLYPIIQAFLLPDRPPHGVRAVSPPSPQATGSSSSSSSSSSRHGTFLTTVHISPRSAPEPTSAGSTASSSYAPDIQARVVSSLQPGCVLVAKPWEYSHFYMKGCLFVYHMDESRGSRAVIMERPTAFNLADLAPDIFSSSIFANQSVFLGGESGGDSAIVLHPYPQVPGARHVGGGIFYGGLKGAEAMLMEQRDAVADHGLKQDKFKFFFNYGSWPPGLLEKEVSEGKWDMMELEPSSILRQGLALEERTLWPFLRRHYLPREDGDEEVETS